MATPQCAMAQPGSFAATSENAFSAFEYQKEWSIARATSNFSCDPGPHEIGK